MGLGERCQHPSPRSCISADLRQHQAHKWDYTGEGDTHSRDAGCVRGPSGSSLIRAPAHHIPKASSDQGWICTLKFLSPIPFHNDTLFYLTMGLHTDIYSTVPPNVSMFLDLGKELRAGGGRGGGEMLPERSAWEAFDFQLRAAPADSSIKKVVFQCSRKAVIFLHRF